MTKMQQSTTKLNTDIPTAINDLEAMMKNFRLKEIYKILFRGKGLEFEAYRDFTPDDDATSIDWKASNRTQKLLVKQYKEERDLRIMFIVDVGDNMIFGSTKKLKCEYSAEVVAALSHLIISSNDLFGFFFFSDAISSYVEPSRGEKHFYFFTDLLTNSKNYGGKTSFNMSLDFAMEYFPNGIDAVIIVSDFLSVDHETEKRLSLFSSLFETILIQVRDPLDFTLPDVQGEIILEDAETHNQVMVNPQVARASYEMYALQHQRLVRETFSKTEAAFLELTTDKPFAEPLAIFLRERGEF